MTSHNQPPHGRFTMHKSEKRRSAQELAYLDSIRARGWGRGMVTQARFPWTYLRPRHLGVALAAALLCLIVNVLPFSCIIALGRSLGLLMRRFMKKRAYVLQTNLALAFSGHSPEERERMARDIFANSGAALLETGIAWYWPQRRLQRLISIDPVELEAARELAARGLPTLVLTGHFFHLEIMARAYAMLIRPGVGVYRPSNDPLWEYVQVSGRLRSNLGLVDRTDGRSLIRALSQGHPIWYAPDQDYGRRAAVFVPFFGVADTATITGTHDLARVRGTLVQPAWTVRTARGYTLRILPPLHNFPTADKVADTTRVNDVLQEMIMTAPTQYLWMHRRFKTDPDGHGSRYPDIL